MVPEGALFCKRKPTDLILCELNYKFAKIEKVIYPWYSILLLSREPF